VAIQRQDTGPLLGKIRASFYPCVPKTVDIMAACGRVYRVSSLLRTGQLLLHPVEELH
jgi:hypothetical protein